MKKYKILVLTELNDSTSSIIKSTISLARLINGHIDVFSVKKPTAIVESENQLSSIREINNQHLKMERKLKKLIDPISVDYNIAIQSSFAFGNVETEIDSYIDQSQPDIIVLGRRKSSSFKFFGDNITQFILKKFDGVVMIASESKALDPKQELSLGLLNDSESIMKHEFVDLLLSQTKKPIKTFKTSKNTTLNGSQVVGTIKTIDYVFEHNDNSIDSISNFLTKSDVNLLCFDREKKGNAKTESLGISNINSIINAFDVSLLVGSR